MSEDDHQVLKTLGVLPFNLFCLINRKLFKHDIVYLVCLWKSPATECDFSETNASFIFMGTGEQLPHSCLILVARGQGFYYIHDEINFHRFY